MKKKRLTLKVEKETIMRAKDFARQSGRSLSQLIENYLRYLVKDENSETISKKLTSLIGSVKVPKGIKVYEKLKVDLEKKHFLL
jgi:hypothetical protein